MFVHDRVLLELALDRQRELIEQGRLHRLARSAPASRAGVPGAGAARWLIVVVSTLLGTVLAFIVGTAVARLPLWLH